MLRICPRPIFPGLEISKSFAGKICPGHGLQLICVGGNLNLRICPRYSIDTQCGIPLLGYFSSTSQVCLALFLTRALELYVAVSIYRCAFTSPS